jgi:hypothetical protein
MRPGIRRAAVWLVSATLGGAILAAQGGTFQTRDTVRDALPSGHGSIAGMIVTDDSSGSPLPRATVTVTSAEGQPVATVYSDARGQFLAKDLPAGRYAVVATKPAFVRAPYGARRFDRPGTPITLAEGQAVSNLRIAMARGAVITGLVTDDGQPIPGVVVRVLQYRTLDGERSLAPVTLTGGPWSDVTDDRGRYRIYGLAAGEYIVSVSPRPMAGGDIRQMTPADIQSVRQAMQAAGTAGAAPVHPPDPVTVAYATVYYPGTTVSTSATPVAVGAGEERNGVDLSMQLVRTAHVDGIVLTPNGVPPQSVQVLLVQGGLGSPTPLTLSVNRATVGPDGKFSYVGVAPGPYTISARATIQGGNGANANAGFGRGLAPALPVPPGAQGPILWGQAEVAVNGDNLSGVTVTLQPGLTVSGQITALVAGGPAPDLTKARVSLAPASMANGLMINMPTPTIDPSGHFTLTGVVPGRYRLSAQLSTANTTWTAKSAILKGQDVLDAPFDITPTDEITNAAITFTTETQDVSGHLQDASGRPATDYTMVLFPADRAAWASSRRVKTARPATDGRFVVADVPAGEYRLAAVLDVAPGETSDASFLEEISPASITLTLHPGEKKVQDVRLTGG